MAKRILALLLCCCMALSLAACESHTDAPAAQGPADVAAATTPPQAPTESNAPASADPYAPAEQKTDEYDALSVKQLEFQNFSYEIETTDGYQLEITYGISPWIKYDDDALLGMTWKKVSSSSEFPHSKTFAVGDKILSGQTINDLVYAFGWVSVKNLTSDFDITPNVPLSIEILLGTEPLAVKLHDGNYLQGYSELIIPWSSGDKRYGSLTSTDGCVYKDMHDGFPTMKLTENYGKVPFVIAAPIINVSPNLPLGEPNPSDICVRVYQWKDSYSLEELHLFDSNISW